MKENRLAKYKKGKGQKEVDLVPFMNLMAILIPALMISTEYIKIATIAVASPQIGPSEPAEQKEKDPDEKPPLNLTLAISSLGIYVASANNVLPKEEGQTGPTIPKVSVKVYYGRGKSGREEELLRVWNYKGEKYKLGVQKMTQEEFNTEIERIKSKGALRTLEEMDHNFPALQQKLIDIKEKWEDEKQVIISADPNVSFSTIIRTMDSSRDYTNEDDEKKLLFPQVVLSAGVV